jgi:hypothetical protein
MFSHPWSFPESNKTAGSLFFFRGAQMFVLVNIGKNNPEWVILVDESHGAA